MTILNIALGIAKWMNGFDPSKQENNEDFDVPKELHNFDSLVNNTFGTLKSSSRKNFPNINKIPHMMVDEGSPTRELSN